MLERVKAFIAIFISALALSACASFVAELEQGYVAGHCTITAAYSQGLSDGENRRLAVANYATDCPDNKDALNAEYLSGYKDGVRSRHHEDRHSRGRHPYPEHECIESFGDKVCGYNCVQAGSKIRCAATPYEQCLAGDWDEIACGYNCMKNSGKVKCARYRIHNCVSTSFGEITCGLNCRIDFSQAVCERKE